MSPNMHGRIHDMSAIVTVFGDDGCFRHPSGCCFQADDCSVLGVADDAALLLIHLNHTLEIATPKIFVGGLYM